MKIIKILRDGKSENKCAKLEAFLHKNEIGFIGGEEHEWLDTYKFYFETYEFHGLTKKEERILIAFLAKNDDLPNLQNED